MTFDPTHMYLDPSYQATGDINGSKAKDDQVFANCTAAQTFFGLGHSIITGAHSGLTLSGYANDASQVSAFNATSPGPGTWQKSVFSYGAASPPAGIPIYAIPQLAGALTLTGHIRVSGAGIVEVIAAQSINGAVFGGGAGSPLPANCSVYTPQVYQNLAVQSVDGATYSISVKGFIIANGQPTTPANGAYIQANTSSMAIARMAYLISHYDQKHANLVRFYNDILADHDAVTGASHLNATPPYGDGIVTSNMAPADNYTAGATVIKTLMAHSGAFPVWTFNILPQSGIIQGPGVNVVVRPGFDDKNVYACITGFSGGPMVTESYTLQSTFYDTTAPANYPTLNVTNPAVLYYSRGVNIDQTQLTALKQLLAIWGLEHNWIGGGHKVPLSRMPGATLLTGTVNVSGSVGTTVKVAIDTASSSSYYYYLPAMVGQAAGCGIADAGIGSDNANVYLLATRRTSGSSSTFNYSVLRINDS